MIDDDKINDKNQALPTAKDSNKSFALDDNDCSINRMRTHAFSVEHIAMNAPKVRKCNTSSEILEACSDSKKIVSISIDKIELTEYIVK